ncbi:hypothetical protein TWF481_002701 [Arthrobotrys musiformis]|uniref:Uncharacterized protein n=1 Tax=Arthrobotrys musiformis TaxID=47236 RepID=A0AAV9VR64_9PEZI
MDHHLNNTILLEVNTVIQTMAKLHTPLNTAKTLIGLPRATMEEVLLPPMNTQLVVSSPDSSNCPAGGYAFPPEVLGAPREIPRNLSTHNYNFRVKPSDLPPETEFQFYYSHIPTQSFASNVSWRPTAAPETKKLSVFRSFRTGLHNTIRKVTNTNKTQVHSEMHEEGICMDPDHLYSSNRFESFAGVCPRNSVK